MSGISAIYILDHKGRVLITRSYRGDTSQNIHEKFNQKMLEYDELTTKPIITLDDGTTFFYKKVNNVMFLAVTKRNSNAAMIIAFLLKLIDVLQNYFNELEEESVRDNFVVIYELLDEMMDNGYPQTTDAKILSDLIKTERHVLKKDKKKDDQLNDFELSKVISNVVSWRREGLVYKKNEVFLDVIEKVNMIIGNQGNVIKSEVLGALKMKCFLTGMPELKLGINDKLLYEIQGRTSNRRKTIDVNDMKFHSCVRLSKFENERVISFIPPDGEFELLSYRLDIQVKPLIMVEVVIENKTATRIDFLIRAKSNFKAQCIANNVDIFIPVPSDAFQPSLKTANGKATYHPDKDAINWSLKQLAGHKDISMNASFHLPTVVSTNRNNFMKLPVQVTFEIPYFTVSGIQIRYLKIQDKSGYQAYPWVRYISKNGDYHIRTGLQ